MAAMAEAGDPTPEGVTLDTSMAHPARVYDIDTGRVTEGTARLNQRMGPTQLTLRTRPDFEQFFGGPEMVEPGFVPLPEWHGPGSAYPIPCYAGMGRNPYGLVRD